MSVGLADELLVSRPLENFVDERFGDEYGASIPFRDTFNMTLPAACADEELRGHFHSVRDFFLA